MSKQHNYDTKSSIFDIDYKIPYEISEGSMIIEQLQQSQSQLQFLKDKLSQAYSKLEEQINHNVSLSQQCEFSQVRIKQLYQNWQLQITQNNKLKQVLEKIINNRKLLEQELQYLKTKHQFLLKEKQSNYQHQIKELQVKIKEYKTEITLLQDQNEKLKEKRLKTTQSDIKISVLEGQIKKITNQKVTEVNRLRHQIQCYQRSTSPFSSTITTSRPKSKMNKIQSYFQDLSSQANNQNVNILQQNAQSKVEDDKVGKWKRSHASSVNEEPKQLTDDQRLTKCQIQRKRVQNQLFKMERLKRPNQSDRDLIAELEKKIYSLDSQISGLKRKIRQKY